MMKLNKILLSSVLISALALPSMAEDKVAPVLEEDSIEFEVSGVLKNETAIFTKDTSNYKRNTFTQGNVLGAEHSSGDVMKVENSLNLFINSELYDDVNMHIQLNIVNDSKGADGYKWHRINTQNDYLREFYIDTTLSDWDVRVGKQQVVWGTADGVKFLDIINPTDYREWGQNTMEDSRIPLWMLTAETSVGDGDGAIQLLWVPDLEINQIPGLNNPNTGDTFQPFVSLGVDSITGDYNGFLNIGKEFGKVATAFSGAFNTAFGAPMTNSILAGFGGMTVKDFTLIPDVADFLSNSGAPAGNIPLLGFQASSGDHTTNLQGQITNPGTQDGPTGTQMLNGTVNGSVATGGISAETNLFDGTLSATNQNDIFDYLQGTTFATFNDFQGMKTEYRRSHVDEELKNHNLGFRYTNTTDNGTNYSFNYYYHWDNNPTIDMHWEDASGNRLNTNIYTEGNQNPATYKSVKLMNSDGSDFNPTVGANNVVTSGATLVFEENMHRVHSIGGSFDTTIDTDFAPFVLRGEFVYDKGTKQVVMDKGLLDIGDLAGAIQSENADMIKFVLGLDVTVMTNLFVSLQYMQLTNLDYIDTASAYGNSSTSSFSKYTANPATMHITNGFAAAEEHQTGFTLFLSKPFLEGDALRVNNIFLYENEEAGIWNRFDLEYSWSDEIILTAEYNYYGGDDNAVFGQFVEQSNLQAGFKYIF